ncbi:MAG: ATP-binding cassette domain-containing protein [Proteobacteria bacterium]|nr:ATP-binding cassette domain-containing protein [Pseudomonadota bacterium]MBU1737766.1 ATP-binding cassette domain-containing protein [Pseudomonadota bacterium]
MGLKVNIVKALPGFDINISFACGSGEFLALVGPSGAGKTTIMRIIAGLDQPDVGRISFNEVSWLDSRQGINLPPQKRNLGYVFQEYTLFPNLTVWKNVAFAAKDNAVVAELLKLFDILHLRDRKPRKLSGGERQRVALAQALAREPDILLLDEPFSALDVVSRQKLRQEVKTISKTFALPVIHITHDLEEARSLADTLLPIVQGRIDQGWLTDHPISVAGERRAPRRGKIVDLCQRPGFKEAAEG